MNATVTFDQVGRVVVPKSIRDKCGARTFVASWTGKEIVLSPVQEEPRKLIKMRGVWILAPTGKRSDSGKLIREERESRA